MLRAYRNKAQQDRNTGRKIATDRNGSITIFSTAHYCYQWQQPPVAIDRKSATAINSFMLLN